MNDADLLLSIARDRNKARHGAGKAKPEAEEAPQGIDDITFMLHRFPQFTLQQLLDMPEVTYRALLRNGKADYYEEHLQMVFGLAAAMASDPKAGEKYVQNIQEEIKGLRQ